MPLNFMSSEVIVKLGEHSISQRKFIHSGSGDDIPSGVVMSLVLNPYFDYYSKLRPHWLNY